MKKSITITSILLGILILFSGCEKELNIEPETTRGITDFYSNPSEADIAIAGIYSTFADKRFYGEGYSIVYDSGTDEGYYNRRFNEAWTVGLYRHTPNDRYVADFWAQLYEAINLSNLFLENIKPEGFTNDELVSYQAEVRFLRAHAYQLLASLYGEVPLVLKATSSLADNNIAVSSLEEIYAQVIEDFTFAAENLPNADDPSYVPGRANAMAARGLMARAYLKMATFPLKDVSKYALAKEQCEIIINSGVHGLNPTTIIIETLANGDILRTAEQNGYRDHFLNYIQNTYDLKESLFEISYRYLLDQDLRVDGSIGSNNGLSWQKGTGSSGEGFPFSFAQLNASAIMLSKLYDDQDIRKAWNIPGFLYNRDGDIVRVTPLKTGYCPGKYRRWEPADFDDLDKKGEDERFTLLEDNQNPTRFGTGINFPVLRYSDVLLMYAEAENAMNGPANALPMLNMVRDRAGLDLIVTGIRTTDPTAFFNELVDERSRELCFEGIRKHDLIRWELLGQKLQESNDAITGDPLFDATDDNTPSFLRAGNFFDPARHLSLPYPFQEVSINSKLDQKPEW